MTDRVSMLLRGRMLERFIGRALKEGVRFQSVKRTDVREMRLTAAEKDARRLVALADQFGMELRIEGTAGKPLLMKRMRERSALPVGLLLSLMLIVSFTARIWRVEAVSLDGQADGALLRSVCESASELGARPGKLRKDIDRDELTMQLHALWPGLTHIGVRTEGVFLRIEVAMEKAAPEIYDISAGRDLVASRDAIVVYAEPLAGRVCVKAGDTVRRGQTLIRGEERIDADVTRSIRALGTVVGRVWFSAECEAPVEEPVTRRTGNRRNASWLRLGSWSWMLTQADGFASQEAETEFLPIGGLYLPLRIERTIFWETQISSSEKNPDALREELGTASLEAARGQLPGEAQETDCWIDYSEENGILTARATVQAEMNIAVNRGQIAD